MRLLFAIIIALILGWIPTLFLPWWTVLIGPTIVATYLSDTAGRAFWVGFGAVFLLWAIQTGFTHIQSGGLLTERVAAMFQVGSPFLVILLTAVFGGLLSGFSSLTVYLGRMVMVSGR